MGPKPSATFLRRTPICKGCVRRAMALRTSVSEPSEGPRNATSQDGSSAKTFPMNVSLPVVIVRCAKLLHSIMETPEQGKKRAGTWMGSTISHVPLMDSDLQGM